MSDELKRKLLSAWGAPEHDTLCQMRADNAIALIRGETLEEAAKLVEDPTVTRNAAGHAAAIRALGARDDQ